ncbi:hypothetical protein DFH94DRAFT_699126 [Russula ochroleuca]|uniref:Uncharacterized protein n=1 Tax=Russula ochroleuca TaxID=152965 RepID=A0A9P5JVY1_9AGAM|nr:hypothetical protein DFH94DRAFT_699126 [Russula ochroleuca]
MSMIALCQHHAVGHCQMSWECIEASGVPHSKIFAITGVNNIDDEDVFVALSKSLALLGTDFIDLCARLSPHDRKLLLTTLLLSQAQPFSYLVLIRVVVGG